MMCPSCDKTMWVTAEEARARCVVRRRECRHCKTTHETREVLDTWLADRVRRLDQMYVVLREMRSDLARGMG